MRGSVEQKMMFFGHKTALKRNTFRECVFIRTHDLLRLLEKCVTYDEVFVELKNACIVLSDYYIDTRYPDIWDRDRFDDKKMAEEALKLTISTIDHIDVIMQKYQKK